MMAAVMTIVVWSAVVIGVCVGLYGFVLWALGEDISDGF